MLPGHAAVVDGLRARFEPDPAAVALVLVGSVARGAAHARSDVDAYLVVTAAELVRRAARLEHDFVADDLVPGVHAGGPIVDVDFLRDVAARGPEPARYAFQDARIVFSRDDELPALLARIPVYPEGERDEKLMSFASQLPVHLSYLVLAERSRNAWLLAQTATELVLFGGRLILAHNRILYPNRKQFMRVLASAPEKPADLIGLATALVERPSIAAAQAFVDAVMGYRAWPVPPEGHWSRFRHDRETSWRGGGVALADS